MKSKPLESATAFAPATVANVAVGFDLLGFPIDGPGDRVTVTKISGTGRVEIEKISGGPGISLDPQKNTATVGLLRLCRDLSLQHGFRVSIEKGIPIGSGMGGSAASAVGAIVAANALLDLPLAQEKLIEYALEGEAVASGSRHADNIAPCLLGGLVLSRSLHQFVRIPVPARIFCVLVHPDIRVDTREARGILKPEISLKNHVAQSGCLAGFLAGCFKSDLTLIRDSFNDHIIEPQRSHLIPGFKAVKTAALQAGALGCSISGSGPSVFAWVDGPTAANQVKKVMTETFIQAGVQSVDAWISPIRLDGAVIL